MPVRTPPASIASSAEDHKPAATLTKMNTSPSRPRIANPPLFGPVYPRLGAPGPGIGNDTALRQVLIVAENDVDVDADGAVDVPDDAAAGGIITVGWATSDIYFQSATVVDIDTNESAFLRVIPNTGSPVDLPLAALGNNSVQTLSAVIGPARQIELHLSGSGALAELRICSD